MVFAALAFTIMIGAVKIARRELGAIDVIFWRALVALPLVTLLLRERPRVARPGLLLIRCTLGFAAMFCFYTAAKGLTVANLSLISKLQPVLIAIWAPFLLGRGEHVSRATWVALIIGLGGTVFIIGPDLEMGSNAGLWAAAATLGSAGAHLAVRGLTRTVKTTVIVFWFQVFLVGAAALSSFAVDQRPPTMPTAATWGAVVVCGVSAAAGQVLMTRAYSLDRAAPVAAASYAGPLWAVVLDAAVFAVWPSVPTAVGGALIIVAGVLLLRDLR